MGKQIPKSRLYITYRTRIDGQTVPKKLPLRLLVLGDFYGGHPSPVSDDLSKDLWSVSPEPSIDERRVKSLANGVPLSSFMEEMKIMAPIEDEALAASMLGQMSEAEAQLKITRENDDGYTVIGIRAVGAVSGYKDGRGGNSVGNFSGRVFIEGQIEATRHTEGGEGVYRLAIKQYLSKNDKDEDGNALVYDFVRLSPATLLDDSGKLIEAEIVFETPEAKDKDGNDLTVEKFKDGAFLDANGDTVEGIATFQAAKYNDKEGNEVSGVTFQGPGIIVTDAGNETFKADADYDISWKDSVPKLHAQGNVYPAVQVKDNQKREMDPDGVTGRVGKLTRTFGPHGEQLRYDAQPLQDVVYSPDEASTWDVSNKPDGVFIVVDDNKRAGGTVKCDEVPVRLTITLNETECFRPDKVAHQIPEVHRLLVIKELLAEMQTHVGNNYVFSDAMRAILGDASQNESLRALTAWMKREYPQLAITPPPVEALTKKPDTETPETE